MHVCVCVCVCARARVCVCVCVCVHALAINYWIHDKHNYYVENQQKMYAALQLKKPAHYKRGVTSKKVAPKRVI